LCRFCPERRANCNGLVIATATLRRGIGLKSY
jgi:hypothetical protein